MNESINYFLFLCLNHDFIKIFKNGWRTLYPLPFTLYLLPSSPLRVIANAGKQSIKGLPNLKTEIPL